jgi:hypothetical protein
MNTLRITARELGLWILNGETSFKTVIFDEIIIFKFYPLKRSFH